MFPRPFQYFNADSFTLADFIECCVVCWIVLGLPSLALVFGLSRLRIFRWLCWRRVAWLLPLFGLLFGLATGYFNVWTDHQSDTTGQDHWYYFLSLFGAPGNGMANSYGGDWQWDEAWDYRSDIAIWNALFWLSVATAAVCLLRFVFRQTAAKTALDCAPAVL